MKPQRLRSSIGALKANFIKGYSNDLKIGCIF